MLKKIKSWLFPELEELQGQINFLLCRIQESEEKGFEAPLDLINNLQVRVLGLEEKYQNHKEFKPVPTGHGTFRAQRQALERGAYAKARRSS